MALPRRLGLFAKASFTRRIRSCLSSSPNDVPCASKRRRSVEPETARRHATASMYPRRRLQHRRTALTSSGLFTRYIRQKPGGHVWLVTSTTCPLPFSQRVICVWPCAVGISPARTRTAIRMDIVKIASAVMAFSACECIRVGFFISLLALSGVGARAIAWAVSAPCFALCQVGSHTCTACYAFRRRRRGASSSGLAGPGSASSSVAGSSFSTRAARVRWAGSGSCSVTASGVAASDIDSQ